MKGEEINITKNILTEIECIFEKHYYVILSEAMRDFREGRLKAGDFEELLMEWNTKINRNFVKEEEDADRKRNILSGVLITLQNTLLIPQKIISISRQESYDYNICKQLYLIIINETENFTIPYQNMTFTYVNKKDRDNEINWLKETLTYMGIKFYKNG